MAKLGKVIPYVVFAALAVIILIIALSFLTQLGTKTLVNETIVLTPGGVKTYNMPPGLTYIELQSSAPVDYVYENFEAGGEGHNVHNGKQWSGSLFSGKYTLTNNGTADASVSMYMTTGVLNPYTFI